MVPILRRCKPQNRLQEPVQMGRGPQIFAADDQSHPLEMVVQGGAEVIARRRIAAAQHHVPEMFRFGPGFTQIGSVRFGLAEGERTGLPDRLCDIEAQREGGAGRLALGRKNRIEAAAGSGIDHGLAFMRRRGRGGDILAAAETGIKQAGGFEAFERCGVVGKMLRLSPHRLFPIDSQPMQILDERRFEFRLAARAVDILDAEQEAAAALTRGAMGEECGMSMAEMEKACRTGRESRNNLGSEGEGHGGQE